MPLFADSLIIVTAYLAGSLSSAIIICQLMSLPDPRTQGSRNPGATNVLRIGGKKAAALTLLGDVLKGFLPVIFAKHAQLAPLYIGLTAFAAFLGHLFPIFFHFRGGKGIATFLGCVLALSWQAGMAWVGIWLIMAALFRYSSLASLTASLFAPILIWQFNGRLYDDTITVTLLMSIMLTFCHHENIERLWKGTERKISKNVKK